MTNSMRKFSDRERFNWGFHDGTRDAEDGRVAEWYGKKPHHDRIYEAGYRKGIADFMIMGIRTESSDQAWEDFNRTAAQQVQAQFSRTCQSL